MPAFSAPMSLPFGVRPTATRIRSNVSVAGALAALEVHRQTLPAALRLVTFALSWMASYCFEIASQRRHDIVVGARHDLVHQLDDRHLRAERVIDGRHLQADDAAADDQQPLRHAVQLERSGRIDDARIVVRNERQFHGLRSGRDDRTARSSRSSLLPSLGADFDWFGETNRPVPWHHVTLRCFASTARPPVSRFTTPSFQSRSFSMSIKARRS